MTISASILSSDLCNIEKTVRLLEKNQISAIHFDVMDGVFVPNITFGLPVLSSLRKITKLPIDVHLMINLKIENPIPYVLKFAEAGADSITVHYEACDNAEEILRAIRQIGIKAGIAINPKTPADNILRFAEIADLLLVMSVEPGYGGQKFIPESIDKIEFIKDYCKMRKLNLPIQVDGGIDDTTFVRVYNAGADNIVSGSFLIDMLSNGKRPDFLVTQEIKYSVKKITPTEL